jgi:archaeal flagellin FlaB
MNFPELMDEAFTGLEAAIVLIAFIVVAAVFAYVVLGAGFFATQKAQETVHTGVQQTTSGVQPSGQLSIQANGAGDSVGNITFYLQLAAGGTGADMSTFSYTVSSTTKVETFTNSSVTYSWVKEVTAGGNNHGDHTGLLGPREMVLVRIPAAFTGTDLPAGTRFLVEVKPAIGAPVPIGGAVPVSMSANNWYDVY